MEWSLIDVIRGAPGAPGLDRVDVVQPVLWAMMVSLAELWRSVGVHPDAVIGHSQGEIAAAYVAGALSLEDAARVVALRSRLLVRLSGAGGMVSLACGLPQARELLAQSGDRLNIAAVNGVSAIVVSGEVDALDELMRRCEAADVRARRIDVDYASHSAQVDAIREPLAEALTGIEPRSSSVAFFSTRHRRTHRHRWFERRLLVPQHPRRLCNSNRRCAPRATPGTGCSSSPARIRC